MTKRYRVVLQRGPSPAVQTPLILAHGLTLGAARRYVDSVLLIGGKVVIEEEAVVEDKSRNHRALSPAPLEDFIMCPQCGFKQRKEQKCTRCGRAFKVSGGERR